MFVLIGAIIFVLASTSILKLHPHVFIFVNCYGTALFVRTGQAFPPHSFFNYFTWL